MRCRKALAGAAFIGALGAVSSDRAGAASATICFDSSSPSASIDKRVAKAAARVMGSRVSVAPYDGSTGVSDRYFSFLAHQQCALIMGFPVDAVDPDPPGGLALTRSYLRTGYVIASLRRPRTLASIPRGTAVSVGSSTVPNFYLVGALGPARPLVSDVHLSQAAALDALVHHQTSVAMVWAPSVLRYESTHAGTPRIFMASLPIPHARWGVAALYAQTQSAFAKRFDAALASLDANGTLAHISGTAGLEAK